MPLQPPATDFSYLPHLVNARQYRELRSRLRINCEVGLHLGAPCLTQGNGPHRGRLEISPRSNLNRKQVVDLKVDDIQAGDVLLGYSSMTADEETAGRTGYSHAAIALRDGRVLDASSEGVRVIAVARLLEDYDHCAVLREFMSNELWDEMRLKLLEEFATEATGKGFNQKGLRRFYARKESRRNDLMERICGHFEGTTEEVPSSRHVYFCSELIIAAFIRVGIIEQSAAQAFLPETLSPSNIAEDKAFGFFFGYVKSTSDYIIPDGDFFESNV